MMIEKDTVRLLRECDAGVKMGISSIDDVVKYVKSDALRERLEECRLAHKKLDTELQELLERYRDDGKEPSAIAKGMSRIKTEMKLAMHESDHTIAELMTDAACIYYPLEAQVPFDPIIDVFAGTLIPITAPSLPKTNPFAVKEAEGLP